MQADRNPFRRILRIFGVAFLVVVAAPLFVAEAVQAKGVRGRCGLHIGDLVRRDSGGSVYRMRIGPREYHVGGDMRCRGYAIVAASAPGDFGTHWQPFSLPDWRYFFVGRITFESALTAQGCKTFGTEIVATLVTDGLASPGMVLGGAGCAYGVYQLGSLLPGTDNMRNMRLVK